MDLVSTFFASCARSSIADLSPNLRTDNAIFSRHTHSFAKTPNERPSKSAGTVAAAGAGASFLFCVPLCPAVFRSRSGGPARQSERRAAAIVINRGQAAGWMRTVTFYGCKCLFTSDVCFVGATISFWTVFGSASKMERNLC